MNLVKFNPVVTRPSVYNLFDEFFGNSALNDNRLVTKPAVNVREEEKRFVIDVAAPGIDKNNFSLEVEKDVLYIRYEHKEEKKDEGVDYKRREYEVVSFSRSFSLSDSIDQDKISASYKDGILCIELPKKKEVVKKPKMISVN